MGNNRKDYRELKLSGYYEGGFKVAPMLRLKGKSWKNLDLMSENIRW